ncbi:MAG: hypothetical protein U9O78_02890, partial [Patescibacteria group bacterium]|nr:hypothetical protein [Patescibacteria group bacterium]
RGRVNLTSRQPRLVDILEKRYIDLEPIRPIIEDHLYMQIGMGKKHPYVGGCTLMAFFRDDVQTDLLLPLVKRGVPVEGVYQNWRFFHNVEKEKAKRYEILRRAYKVVSDETALAWAATVGGLRRSGQRNEIPYYTDLARFGEMNDGQTDNIVALTHFYDSLSEVMPEGFLEPEEFVDFGYDSYSGGYQANPSIQLIRDRIDDYLNENMDTYFYHPDELTHRQRYLLAVDSVLAQLVSDRRPLRVALPLLAHLADNWESSLDQYWHTNSPRMDLTTDIVARVIVEDGVFSTDEERAYWLSKLDRVNTDVVPRESLLQYAFHLNPRTFYRLVRDFDREDVASWAPADRLADFEFALSLDEETVEQLNNLCLQTASMEKYISQGTFSIDFLKLLVEFDYSQLAKRLIETDETFYEKWGLTKEEKMFWELFSRASHGFHKTLLEEKVEFIRIIKAGEDLEVYLGLMERIDQSPAQEIQRLKFQILRQLVLVDDPFAFYDEIELVFVENNLPLVGKILRVFQILYPPDRVEKLLLEKSSPVLKKENRVLGTYNRRYDIIYRDLLKSHLLSGERSLLGYLKVIDQGLVLIDRFEEGEDLSPDQRRELERVLNKLLTLQQSSLFGLEHQTELTRANELSEQEIKTMVEQLREDLGVAEGQTLQERVETMFLRPIGVESISAALELAETARQQAHQRGQELVEKSADGAIMLEAGDFIKGVNVGLIKSILGSGVSAGECLGSNADSDATPLGTDGVVVEAEELGEGQAAYFEETPAETYAKGLYLVIKDRGQFHHTESGEDVRYDPDGYEIYKTGVVSETHHDIRTAIPSTEIDYLIADGELINNSRGLKELFLAIAKQGVYLPVVNETGLVIFSYDDYQTYRANFAGIGYYRGGELPITRVDGPFRSEVQQVKSAVIGHIDETKQISQAVRAEIEKVLGLMDIVLSPHGDTSLLGAKLYDTGSTGRHTDDPEGEIDFDLILDLDTGAFEHAMAIKAKMIQSFEPEEDASHTEEGYVQVRSIGSKAVIPGEKVDIDVGIRRKAELKPFTTDEAISAKLGWIRDNLGEDQYYEVVTNIVLVKRLLKGVGVYKKLDGGFGGVGVETWILSNDGNLETAFNTFWEAAHDEAGNRRSLSSFREHYTILDPGINFKFNRHDDYVYVLDEAGYKGILDLIETRLGK